MAVIHSPESNYAKERAKWEANHTEFGAPGRQYVHQIYPTMMYKAGRINDGPIGIVDHQEAGSEAEQRNLESLGFVHGGAAEAIKAFERWQTEMAMSAAERNFDDRRMSDKAKAESSAAEAASSEHLADVPTTPIKPRK